jgi:hypothetical protein
MRLRRTRPQRQPSVPSRYLQVDVLPGAVPSGPRTGHWPAPLTRRCPRGAQGAHCLLGTPVHPGQRQEGVPLAKYDQIPVTRSNDILPIQRDDPCLRASVSCCWVREVVYSDYLKPRFAPPHGSSAHRFFTVGGPCRQSSHTRAASTSGCLVTRPLRVQSGSLSAYTFDRPFLNTVKRLVRPTTPPFLRPHAGCRAYVVRNVCNGPAPREPAWAGLITAMC